MKRWVVVGVVLLALVPASPESAYGKPRGRALPRRRLPVVAAICEVMSSDDDVRLI